MIQVMELEKIQTKIVEVRGVKVILDNDLAELYQVETKRLNEQFKRNRDLFPNEFAFQLTHEEWDSLRSQFATSKVGKGGRRYLPYVFTEYGTLALSSILKSDVAIKVNQIIIRAFVELRKQICSDPSYGLLAERVRRIESEIKELKSAQLVDNKLLSDKVVGLSKTVRTFSEVLDDFQSTHLIIKRPDDIVGEG